MTVSDLWRRTIVQPESTGAGADAPACPLCGCRGLVRVHRRPIDRVLSLFLDMQRFRCRQFECQWEGNLTTRRRLGGTRTVRRVSERREIPR